MPKGVLGGRGRGTELGSGDVSPGGAALEGRGKDDVVVEAIRRLRVEG
jgi:hypothetical protein